MPSVYEEQIAKLEALVREIEDEIVDPSQKQLVTLEEFENAARLRYEEDLAKARARFHKSTEANAQTRASTQQKLTKALTDIERLKRDIREQEQLHMRAIQTDAEKLRLQALDKKLSELAEGFKWFEAKEDYQWTGILNLWDAYEHGEPGVIVADDRGLGKTFQAVAFRSLYVPEFVKKHGRKPRCLYITKKTLIKTAVRESFKWNPEDQVLAISGKPGSDKIITEMAVGSGSLLVVNYDAVRTRNCIRDADWDLIVIDEVHQLKGGPSVARWRAIHEIAQKAEFQIYLSGTPVQNAPEEMWSYLHMFDPYSFPNVRDFKHRFTNWDGTIDKEHVDRLIKLLGRKMYRRDKKDVKLDLPEKRRTVIYLEHLPEEAEMYNEFEKQAFILLDQSDPDAILSSTAFIAKLTRLRQLNLWASGIDVKHPVTGEIQHPHCDEQIKIQTAFEMAEELLAEGEKVLIWSAHFKEPLYELHRRFQAAGMNSVVHDDSNYDTFEEDWQEGKFDIALLNMQRSSHGLNLQKFPGQWEGGASNAIFLDLWYNPAVLLQAEDRLHRKGTPEMVTTYVLYVDNSIDAWMAALVEEKQKMAAMFHDHKGLRPADWKKLIVDMKGFQPNLSWNEHEKDLIEEDMSGQIDAAIEQIFNEAD
jgi:SNF2 family DNA or RNA helicase